MTRCDYAGCPSEAAHSDTCIHDERIVTWYFCDWHIHDHRAEWYSTPIPHRHGTPPLGTAVLCGHLRGYRLHMRQGTEVCEGCRLAFRAYQNGRRKAAA